MRRILLAVMFVGLASGVAHATVITFDDGVAGSPVGAFYSPLGVTFSNTEWADNFGLPGSSGDLGIRAENNGGLGNEYQWLQPAAVVTTFSSFVTSASIVGLDVGANGLRIDAYDNLGVLVDFGEVFGTGLGVGQFFTLSVAASEIARLEIYQLQNIAGDGIVLDTMEFTAVPEPGSLALLTLGLGGLLSRRLRKAPR